MASISISASMQRACSSHHVTKKHPLQARPSRSFGTKQSTQFVSLDIESQQKGLDIAEQKEKSALVVEKTEETKDDEEKDCLDTENSVTKFVDARWKNRTWDLNMFVKDGKMDWDSVIDAEARRRKFLEMYPEESTNQDPVQFRTSIIPWWAWIMHSHLPEAELTNGRAAMVGFIMAYFVDLLTGLDVVGQSGNLICKGGLFMTVIGVIIFRRKDDLEKLKKLADEATFHDKQWQSSWQDQNVGNETSEQSRNKI
ncbi:hypothetical protein CsSME_00028905 [Camellia sinensis var. sinensis]